MTTSIPPAELPASPPGLARAGALPLAELRRCLDGPIYPAMATCSADGVPNLGFVTYVSFIDEEHVALSYRYLGKTARNVVANPRVALLLADLLTCRQHALDLHYLRTEADGPHFEQMRVRLASRAAVSGLSGNVVPNGVQIYRVTGYAPLDRGYVPEPTRPQVSAAATHLLAAEIAACEDLATLLDVTLKGLAEHLHYGHTRVLLADNDARRVYVVASHGYASSGAGAEVAFGEEVIGIAAAERQPVRIGHADRERLSNRWVLTRATRAGEDRGIERSIPLIALPNAQSMLAVPMLARNRLVGVLYAESRTAARYLDDDERTLVAVAAQLGSAILLCSQPLEAAAAAAPGGAARAGSPAASAAPVPAVPAATAPAAEPLLVRRYEQDQSVFLGDDYLIKGVAGAILWKVLNDWVASGRTEFTNRELRLDRSLGLPDVGDNLEARLVLLMRRLVDRDAVVRLDKAGRGRLKLSVARPLQLRSIPRD